MNTIGETMSTMLAQNPIRDDLSQRMTTAESQTLTIHEIYQSIQGESTWAGIPCVFVRLTFCHLRCTYCDTTHAFYDGNKMSLEDIIDQVRSYQCELIEITGGEPLLQKNVLPLMQRLCDLGHTVLIETSGAVDISKIDPRVHRIMDLKTPSSGECQRNLWSNLDHITAQDEIKFVLGSHEDYVWARETIRERQLESKCTLLFSPVFGKINPQDIVTWMLEDKLKVRFQLQMHKFIWPPQQRGV